MDKDDDYPKSSSKRCGDDMRRMYDRKNESMSPVHCRVAIPRSFHFASLIMPEMSPLDELVYDDSTNYSRATPRSSPVDKDSDYSMT